MSESKSTSKSISSNNNNNNNNNDNNEYKFNSSYPEQPIRGVIGTGKQGNKPGEFRFPTSVCYDNQNHHIIVSDARNHRIQLFDSNTLQFHSMFGSKGIQYGRFDLPTGLCIQPFTRNLLVCDEENHRIQIFNNNNNNNTYSFSYQIGSLTGNWNTKKGEFYKPRGICCDEKGHIIVSDSGNHRIQEFNENGQFLHSFGSEGSSFDQFNRPNHICFDKEHHQLLISDCDNKRMSIWSRDNQPISHIKLNDFSSSVCIDPLRNHQIVVGTYHNIFVYDNRNHKHELTQTLGTDKCGSELGEFYYVSGLCVNEDDKSLIVVDCGNHRIQMF